MDLHKVKTIISLVLALTLKKRIRKRRWVKQWLQKRETYTHLNLLKEIQLTAEDADYKNYFRMDEKSFNELLQMITPYIIKQDTCMRKSITPKEKLAVTLRYLATGRNIEDLKFSAIMSPASISEAIKVTCRALIYVLKDYMKVSKNIIFNIVCLLGINSTKHIYTTICELNIVRIIILKQ